MVYNGNAHGRDHRRQRSPEQAHLLSKSKANVKTKEQTRSDIKLDIRETERRDMDIFTLFYFLMCG